MAGQFFVKRKGCAEGEVQKIGSELRRAYNSCMELGLCKILRPQRLKSLKQRKDVDWLSGKEIWQQHGAWHIGRTETGGMGKNPGKGQGTLGLAPFTGTREDAMT